MYLVPYIYTHTHTHFFITRTTKYLEDKSVDSIHDLHIIDHNLCLSLIENRLRFTEHIFEIRKWVE